MGAWWVGTLLGSWLGISCSVGGEQLLSFAPLVFLGFYFPLSLVVIFFFPYNLKFFLIIKLFSSPHTFLSHFYPFDCPPSSHDGVVGKQLCGA